MDGKKFDWIRQQLGLSKVELARELDLWRQYLKSASERDPARIA